MVINRSCKRNVQHWVLWLDGASVAYRTNSLSSSAWSLVFAVPGRRRRRAAFSALASNEHAASEGAVSANAADLNTNCLRVSMECPAR
jgi:hypothetical protein